MYRNLSRVFLRALNIDLRLHQHNLKSLPDKFIMIANHPSSIEDAGVPALFNVYSVAKAEVRKWPILGRIGEKAGIIYFNRECKDARKQCMEDMLLALSNNKNIAIYPEGGCKAIDIHFPFLYGAFDASIRSGVPIIPVFLQYESQQDFAWGPESLPKTLLKIFFSSNKRVNYHVYDALYPSDFKDKHEYSLYAYNLFTKLYKKYCA